MAGRPYTRQDPSNLRLTWCWLPECLQSAGARRRLSWTARPRAQNRAPQAQAREAPGPLWYSRSAQFPPHDLSPILYLCKKWGATFFIVIDVRKPHPAAHSLMVQATDDPAPSVTHTRASLHTPTTSNGRLVHVELTGRHSLACRTALLQREIKRLRELAFRK